MGLTALTPAGPPAGIGWLGEEGVERFPDPGVGPDGGTGASPAPGPQRAALQGAGGPRPRWQPTAAYAQFMRRVEKVQVRLRMSNAQFAQWEAFCTAPEWSRFRRLERKVSERVLWNLLENLAELVEPYCRFLEREVKDELADRRRRRRQAAPPGG